MAKIDFIKYCCFRTKDDFINWVAFNSKKHILLEVAGVSINFLVIYYIFLK